MPRNEFDFIASDIIQSRAKAEHSALCATPEKCTDGWHVQNDYVPRIRREVIAEMRAAASRISN